MPDKTIAEKIGIPALLDMLSDCCVALADSGVDLRDILQLSAMGSATPEDTERAEADLLDKICDVQMILHELDRGGVNVVDGKLIAQKQRELEEEVGHA